MNILCFNTFVNRCDINPFAYVRKVAVLICRHYTVINGISKLCQRVENNEKCPPVIMLHKVRNIFKKYDLRAFFINDTSDLKEQIASFIVETFLLSRHREWLTRESGNKHIKIGNIFCRNIMDVCFYKMQIPEIVSICFASGGIVFICPYNIESGLPKAEINTADS